MNTAVIKRKKYIEIENRPIPQIDENKLLVKVSMCGICGSDLAVYLGTSYKQYPYTPGHEFCGVVVKTGENVKGFTEGDRVVINPNLGCGECRFCKTGRPNLCDNLKTRNIKSNGGLSEYTAVDYRMAYRLPDSVPDEKAVFIEPVSCAIHIIQSARIRSSDTIVVFGAGIMGVLTGLLLNDSGNRVYFVEKDENRRRQFCEILNCPVIPPEEISGPGTIENAHIAINCTGNAHAVCGAIKLLQKNGRLILAGLVKETKGINIPLIDITCKELEVQGVWLNPNTFQKAVDFVHDNLDVFNNISTREIKLVHIKEAFQSALSAQYHKVLVQCT